ncbi:MAG: hypothetical protein FWD36_10490 [Treponema sp.]|nr:hypothetical protein [Treponema sp.]
MKKFIWVLMVLLLCASFLMAAGGAQGGAPKAEVPTFAGKNVRLVIGSTATAGDSYLIAEVTSRYLSKVLNCNIKVDAIGAAKAFDAMITSKPDGNTMMLFHDMTYLGVAFKAFEDIYRIENMTVGPRAVQNPLAAWASLKGAPYNNFVEVAEYLKNSPNEVISMCLEAGGVSHIGFIAYWDWVKRAYGEGVAKRIKVFIGGSTDQKIQVLVDRNTDIIFADYTSLIDYTKTDDPKIAMKYMGLMDNLAGINVPSYADMKITYANGQPFKFSKDFIFYMPKDFPQALVDELNKGMEQVSKDPQFAADLAKMWYRPAYLDNTAAKNFIYEKRGQVQGLIDSAPKLDDLVK